VREVRVTLCLQLCLEVFKLYYSELKLFVIFEAIYIFFCLNVEYSVLEGVKDMTRLLFNPSITEYVQFKNRSL